MAHESHAPDTTFIVAEPDFVFYREDGEKHMEYLNAEEHRWVTFARWDEMADLIPSEQGKAQFRRELQTYLKDAARDKNAPWPRAPVGPLPAGAQGQEQHWTKEAFEHGYGLSYVFARRRKPPATGFRPEDISNHLHDLQAYMTAAFRFGRGGFFWCGRNVVQWQSCEKNKARDPYEAFTIDSDVF